jgi:glycosyltransferase involved in cell wall biosynthesis
VNVGKETEDFSSTLVLPRVHVVTTLNFGGVETQMVELAKYYFEHGISKQVYFLVLGSGGLAEKEILDFQCQVHTLSLRFDKPNINLFMDITKFFLKVKPKAAYFHGAEAILNAIIPARLCGIKLAISEEVGIPNHGFKARLVFRILHRMATVNICSSLIVKQWLIANNETVENRTYVTSLPVRRVLANPRVRNHESNSISYLFLGRFEEVKNLRRYLSAIYDLLNSYDFKDRNAIFNFVGTGAMQEEIENFIIRMNLSSTIKIHKPTLNISEHFLSNDFIVQCSISEGFGLTVVEAMQSGLFPISTNVGIVPALITDGENGIIIKGEASTDILHALESSLDLPIELYESMTLKATETSVDSFSTQKYMKTLSNIESILSANHQ